VNLLTINALCAAAEVLVPLQTEFFSVEGITKIQETVRLVRERWNPALQVGGLVATQVDYRKKMTHDVLASLAEHYPQSLLKTRIRDNSKLGESSGHGKTIFRYAPSSPGAEDYRSLADELLGRPTQF